mgnify:CR=1 FL=1
MVSHYFCVTDANVCPKRAALMASTNRTTPPAATAAAAAAAATTGLTGGGTPSLMPPRLVADTLDTAADLFGFEPDIEITLEANPTSTEAANLEGLAAAGVNRISLGVQSLDAAALAFLGREHSADEALHAIAAARRHFARVSMDLIYARTGQSAQAWMNELQSAIDIGLDHMSLYQLTIEPGTGFYTRTRAGETLVADDDLAADLYQMTDEAMRVAGFDAYQVSNYARAGAARPPTTRTSPRCCRRGARRRSTTTTTALRKSDQSGPNRRL